MLKMFLAGFHFRSYRNYLVMMSWTSTAERNSGLLLTRILVLLFLLYCIMSARFGGGGRGKSNIFASSSHYGPSIILHADAVLQLCNYCIPHSTDIHPQLYANLFHHDASHLQYSQQILTNCVVKMLRIAATKEMNLNQILTSLLRLYEYYKSDLNQSILHQFLLYKSPYCLLPNFVRKGKEQ